MLQKFHITLCAIIAGLFSVLFSPYTAVANDGEEPPVVGDTDYENQEDDTYDEPMPPQAPPQAAVRTDSKNVLNRLPSEDRKEKVPEQKIYWTEGKRIRPDHVGHLPKGGWR